MIEFLRDVIARNPEFREITLRRDDLLALVAEFDGMKAKIERLREEVEVLRQYGNKDCTWQADEEIARRRAERER